mgnify:CR=1 FL=1
MTAATATRFVELVADYEGLVGLLIQQRQQRLTLAESRAEMLVDMARVERAVLAEIETQWVEENRKPNNEALRLAERDIRLALNVQYGAGETEVKLATRGVGMLDAEIESAIYRLSLLKRRMDFEIATERRDA